MSIPRVPSDSIVLKILLVTTKKLAKFISRKKENIKKNEIDNQMPLAEENDFISFTPSNRTYNNLAEEIYNPADTAFIAVQEPEHLDSSSGGTISWTNFDGKSIDQNSEVLESDKHLLLTEDQCSSWISEISTQPFFTSHDIEALALTCNAPITEKHLFDEILSEITINSDVPETIADIPVIQRRLTVSHIDFSDLQDLLFAIANRYSHSVEPKSATVPLELEARLIHRLSHDLEKLLSVVSQSQDLLTLVATHSEKITIATTSTPSLGHPSLRKRELTEACNSDFNQALTNIKKQLTVGQSQDSYSTIKDLSVLAENSDFCISILALDSSSLAISYASEFLKLQQRLSSTFNALITLHLPLVRRIAHLQAESISEEDELFQHAALSLMRSIWRFDPVYGHRLSTFSSRGVWQAMAQYKNDNAAVIRIPANRQVLFKALKNNINNNEPTCSFSNRRAELAEDLGVTLLQLEDMLCSLQTQCPLDDAFDLESDDNPFEQTLSSQLGEAVKLTLQCLPEQHKDILQKRFGLNGENQMTLEEVGKKYEMTRERVRQIQMEAMKNLKRSSYQNQLTQYL